MSAPALCSDQKFIDTWNELGSATLVAKRLRMHVSSVHQRRKTLEARYKIELVSWNDLSLRRIIKTYNEGRIDLQIENGVIVVFSDHHVWPERLDVALSDLKNEQTTMFRALKTVIRQLKPVGIINNGDSFDGGTISRWPRIGWDKKPSVIQELKACEMALGDIYQVGKESGAEWFIWNLGNHDSRYETKLAASAPEFEGVPGFTLKDHFPDWLPAWITWVNGDTCITHRYHSGIHATHNNILKGQVNYVTGHLHSLKWTPWTSANGHTIYGVDTGTLADSLGPHNLDYQEGKHGNHRSGFAVLTWKDGRLLLPEVCQKYDENSFEFRGHVLNADTGEIL